MQLETANGVKGDVSFMAMEAPSRTDEVLAILIDFPDYLKIVLNLGKVKCITQIYARITKSLFSPQGT